MAPVNRLDAVRTSSTYNPHQDHAAEESLDLGDFEAELQRLAAANQELMDEFQAPADEIPSADADKESSTDTHDGELDELRRENADLKARIEELESAPATPDEEQWLERAARVRDPA